MPSTFLTAGNKIKLSKPMIFDGTKGTLKTFLVNMDMHLDANQVRDGEKKIIFVSACLDGIAAE